MSSTVEGYCQYSGGCLVLWRDTVCTVGSPVLWRDTVNIVEDVKYFRGILCSTVEDIQYCRGILSVQWRMSSTVEGYCLYSGGYPVLWRDTFNTVEDVQYCGGILSVQ